MPTQTGQGGKGEHFDIWKPPKKIWRHFLRKSSPKNLETSHTLTFSKLFQIAQEIGFCTMNFEVTCSKIGFKKSIQKNCDIYSNSE